MSEKERIEFSVAIKKFTRLLSKDKGAAKEFLIKAGIITQKGNLREPYKNLCIPKEQV